MPGMGGVHNNENFTLNCQGWATCRENDPALISRFLDSSAFEPKIRLAPMTGAVENIGFEDEQSFYYTILFSAHKAGFGLCVGDGTPDIKLQSGIGAVQWIQKQDNSAKTAVFIKPYDNERIFERITWAEPVAEAIGVDIDSYNIVTMRNLVSLEKKTAAQLLEIKKYIHVPFVIKGVFTEEDIALVSEVRPDIVYISNHGGRVETRTGSTAAFLQTYARELRNNCGALWVDGGIRTAQDVATAMALGAEEVAVGRPLATALCKGGTEAICACAESLRTL
ncbi:MAG: alpha-hydroxy-acid oxidizing protein [Treponema sp.]|nr:alpha-hydroxy-acid oxidizing protein [Treponema sp.]